MKRFRLSAKDEVLGIVQCPKTKCTLGWIRGTGYTSLDEVRVELANKFNQVGKWALYSASANGGKKQFASVKMIINRKIS